MKLAMRETSGETTLGRFLRPLLFVGLIVLANSVPVGSTSSPATVFMNARLIDGTGRPPSAGVTVVVVGNRISQITRGRIEVAPGSRRVDATGLTILPGLIDMHVHARSWMWPLFLKFGVTTIRDTGNDPEYILFQRARFEQEPQSGPRIFACGPLLDGVPPFWGTWRGTVGLASVQEARAEAHRLISLDVNCLKVYARLPAPLLQAIVEIASANNIPVAALPGVVSARDAAIMGVRSIEHARGIRFPLSKAEQTSLIRLFVRRGTYIVPTLLEGSNLANLPRISRSNYPYLNLVPSDQAKEWLNWRLDFRFRELTAKDFSKIQTAHAAKAAFIGRFWRAGGKVAVGSDTPNPFVIAGISVHQEMEHLVAAGLRPMDAIRAATSLAASLLGAPDLGVVAVGKVADLVLIAGDPIKDIRDTRKIRMVVKAGAIVFQNR